MLWRAEFSGKSGKSTQPASELDEEKHKFYKEYDVKIMPESIRESKAYCYNYDIETDNNYIQFFVPHSYVLCTLLYS